MSTNSQPQSSSSSSSSSPRPDQPRNYNSHLKSLNHTSIALISIFLFCFIVFVFISVYGTRASPQTHGTPSNSKKPIEKRKPKLWEVWLDDHYCSFKRLGGAMRDWQPVAVWTDDRPTHHNPRKTCFQEPVIDHHVAMAQAWFRDTYPFHPEHSIRLPSPHPPAPLLVSDRRTINVAVLVAMPSRRLEASPECVMTSHHTIGPRVSYGDGQLLMGVTSLPCEDQVILTARGEYERTT